VKIFDSSIYANMKYNKCGNSGLKLPAISLGLWHNFGGVDTEENAKDLIFTAFGLGITHFDLANNYGPPPGSAEECFGKIFKNHLMHHRDEMVISTKAGHQMWDGPYGNGGGRKYMLASLDQSLKRMGLDYVDIFYSHRFDGDTPLEETMQALDTAVRQGKALYVGISKYNPEQTKKAADILRQLGTPCLIHQPSYSMLNRNIEQGLLDVLESEGIGSIAFCPLQQGLLTNKYIGGVPEGSRASKSWSFLKADKISESDVKKANLLNDIAKERQQSLAQMALAWVLRGGKVTSALIGASKPSQIEENVAALKNLEFTDTELAEIDKILADS